MWLAVSASVAASDHVRVLVLSTFGRRAFSIAGPTVWNSLPDSLRDPALSSDRFRQLLKTNLFQRYNLPLSTHSTVEMLHDSALYKFMIDIDIDSCDISPCDFSGTTNGLNF